MKALPQMAPLAMRVGCTATPAEGAAAVAPLEPAKDNCTSGTVGFTARGDRVAVIAKLRA